MDIAHIRQQIPVTQKAIYLNTGWDGPSPLPVIQAIQSHLEYESHEGPTTPPAYERRRAIFAEARERLAALLNVTSQEVTLTDNTTAGMNVVIHGFPWSPGDEVLTCTMEHSSGLVPLYMAARRHGLKVHVVPLEPLDTPTTIVSKFAASFTPHTRLLVLSHIMYTTGLLIPLKELCALAHDHGALVLVDAAQSVGQMPVDLRDLGCDFYALSGHKWLLGPDGTGALYVREELVPRIEPLFVSGHAVTTYDREGGFQPNTTSIQKFDLTTRSAALSSGLTRAIQFLEDIGLEAVRERVLSLATWLKEELRSVPGVTLHSPTLAETSCGLVTFSLAGHSPQDIHQALWERHHIVCRTISEIPSVRLSVHVFNTREELEEVLRAIAALGLA